MRKKKRWTKRGHWMKRGRNGPLPKPKGKENGKKMKRWKKHINKYHKKEYEHVKKKWNKIAKKAKDEEAYESQVQHSQDTFDEEMMVLVKVNGGSTKTVYMYEEDLMEDRIHDVLGIPYEQIDEMYASSEGTSINLRETAWYNRIREGDTILLNQTLKGGGRNRKRKYEPDSKYWYQRSLRVQTELTIKDIKCMEKTLSKRQKPL
jgi:hypothetical protein